MGPSLVKSWAKITYFPIESRNINSNPAINQIWIFFFRLPSLFLGTAAITMSYESVWLPLMHWSPSTLMIRVLDPARFFFFTNPKEKEGNITDLFNALHVKRRNRGLWQMSFTYTVFPNSFFKKKKTGSPCQI